MPFFGLEHTEDGAKVLHLFTGPKALDERNAWVSARFATLAARIPGGRSFARDTEVQGHTGPVVQHETGGFP